MTRFLNKSLPDPDEPATVAQLNYLYNLLSTKGMDVRKRHGLSKREALVLINKLKGAKDVNLP